MSLVGRTLGDFLLKQRIGVGGGGEVFLAVQATLEREAVVKVKLGRGARDAQAAESFLREARTASTLDHPFAGHIYDFGSEPDGTLWIAMELVRGEPLTQMIAQQGGIPLLQLVPLLDRISEVMQTAHQQGIVHRDIKPDNIMVIGRAGRLLPKLLDFGIASSGLAESATPGEMTQKVGVVGTPHYMPPEQWRTKSKVDARADIYSLGITVYQALTGSTPFASAATVFVLAEAHTNKPIPALPDTLPSALNEVLARATAKKPEDRYASVLDFAVAFRAASGLEIEPLPLPQLERALLENMTAEAPQPIAEAVAIVEGARTLKQQLAAVLLVRRVVYRYLALTALAARVRVGPGAARDADDVRALVEHMAASALDESEWLALARMLTAPFAFRRSVHPLPELVAFFHADASAAPLGTGESLLSAFEALLRDVPADNETLVHARLVELLPALGALLQRLSFLLPYALVVHGEEPERWMGTRRQQRLIQKPLNDPLVSQHPSLVDQTGHIVVSLYPFVQCFAPSGGMPMELFLLEGMGRHGGKLVALPGPFERQSDEVWQALAACGLDVHDAQARAGESDKPPYMGLATFTAADSDNFFGREAEAQAFANRLHSVPFLTVVGPSGAGKSSFVLAGVLPILPGHWKSVVVRPGETPLVTLAARLAAEGLPFNDEGTWYEQLPRDLSLFVVVDQFEELVTLCADPAQREAFAAMLMGVATRSKGRVRVAVTLRDDFLIRIQQIPAFRDRLSSSLQLLTTPAEEELLRVVTEPAARAGYAFDDPELPKQMVRAVLDNPGALALLSFTASQLWELRDRHLLHLQSKTYAALGGVGGALAHHAEQTMLRMAADEQALVREAFRRLVTADGTRAVLSKQELREVLGKSAAGDRVIDQLVAARLLVTSEDLGGDRIEVIHEALLRSWPRLVQWQREDSETARLRDALRTSAQQWRERGTPRGLLWRDEALAEYRVWRARFSGRMTENEEAFARASLAHDMRTRRIRQALAVTAFTGLCVALVIIFNAYRKASANAEESRQRYVTMREEQTRLSLLDQKPLEALAYLDDAIRFGARGAYVRDLGGVTKWLLRGRQGTVVSKPDSTAAFQYDKTRDLGFTLWSSGGAIWSLGMRERRETVFFPLNVGSYSACFSSQARAIAIVSEDRTLRIIDVATGKVTRDIHFDDGTPFFVVEGGEPNTVDVSVANRGVARVNVISGARAYLTSPVHPSEFSVINSPAGDASALYLGGFVSASDSFAGIALLSKSHPRTSTHLSTPAPVTRASFTDDGRYLAAADSVGTVGIYSTVEKKWLWHKQGHAGRIASIAFDPNGTRLVTGGFDGWVRIWNVRSGEPTSFQLPAGVMAVSWGMPLHRSMVVATDERSKMYLIDVETGQFVWQYESTEGALIFADFSSDSKTIVTASVGGATRSWDATTRYALLASGSDPILTFDFDHSHENAILYATTHGEQRLALASATSTTLRTQEIDPKLETTLTAFDSGSILRNGHQISVRHDGGDVEMLTIPVALQGPLASDKTGKRIASLGDDGRIEVLTLDHARVSATQRLRVSDDNLTMGSFIDNNDFATCSDAGFLRRWRLLDATMLEQSKAHALRCSVAMWKNTLRTTSFDDTMKHWQLDAKTMKSDTAHPMPSFANAMNDEETMVIARTGKLTAVSHDGLELWSTVLSNQTFHSTASNGTTLGLCAGAALFIHEPPKATDESAIHALAMSVRGFTLEQGRLKAFGAE